MDKNAVYICSGIYGTCLNNNEWWQLHHVQLLTSLLRIFVQVLNSSMALSFLTQGTHVSAQHWFWLFQLLMMALPCLMIHLDLVSFVHFCCKYYKIDICNKCPSTTLTRKNWRVKNLVNYNHFTKFAKV